MTQDHTKQVMLIKADDDYTVVVLDNMYGGAFVFNKYTSLEDVFFKLDQAAEARRLEAEKEKQRYMHGLGVGTALDPVQPKNTKAFDAALDDEIPF